MINASNSNVWPKEGVKGRELSTQETCPLTFCSCHLVCGICPEAMRFAEVVFKSLRKFEIDTYISRLDGDGRKHDNI